MPILTNLKIYGKQGSLIEVGIVANNYESIGTHQLNADEERMDVVEIWIKKTRNSMTLIKG